MDIKDHKTNLSAELEADSKETVKKMGSLKVHFENYALPG